MKKGEHKETNPGRSQSGSWEGLLSVIMRVSYKRLYILYFSMENNERERAKSCFVHRASACDTQCLKDS